MRRDLPRRPSTTCPALVYTFGDTHHLTHWKPMQHGNSVTLMSTNKAQALGQAWTGSMESVSLMYIGDCHWADCLQGTMSSGSMGVTESSQTKAGTLPAIENNYHPQTSWSDCHTVQGCPGDSGVQEKGAWLLHMPTRLMTDPAKGHKHSDLKQ